MKHSNERKGGTASSRRPPSHIRYSNLFVFAVGVLFIVAGMLLMLPPKDIKSEPGGRYKPVPTEGVFAARRIRLAPFVAFLGFVIVPFSLAPGWASKKEI
ncbi:MAG: DUF3098 domain-containing protein [Bacteroidaceae bacterium]|nr:DUF3098 domain-containing protein [Bacteroidaceae bacterium]